MKKTLLLASVFAVGAAVATDFESGNVLGVLQVNGSAKPKRVLLSVPFAGYGKDAEIKVSELVETSSLPAGTKLRVAHGDGYYVWNLTEGKTWDPEDDAVFSIDANGEQDQNKVVTPEADTVEIGRGNSFWLELPPESSDVTFTLIGQQDLSGKSITLTGGKWNLVGNPNVAEYDVAANISSKAENDYISVQDGNSGYLKTYRYNGTKWTCGRTGYDAVKVNPGDGCWVRVANDATLSF